MSEESKDKYLHLIGYPRDRCEVDYISTYAEGQEQTAVDDLGKEARYWQAVADTPSLTTPYRKVALWDSRTKEQLKSVEIYA